MAHCVIVGNAYKLLCERFMQLWANSEAKYEKFVEVVTLLRSWQQRLEFLPAELKPSKVFSITPRDFGYDSWLVKTPDSSFFESYILKSHLLNGSAVSGSDEPAPFPDFLWVCSSDRTKERGLCDWLVEGPPTGFPYGDIALRGHMEWYRRFSETVNGVFEFVDVFRRIVWP